MKNKFHFLYFFGAVLFLASCSSQRFSSNPKLPTVKHDWQVNQIKPEKTAPIELISKTPQLAKSNVQEIQSPLFCMANTKFESTQKTPRTLKNSITNKLASSKFNHQIPSIIKKKVTTLSPNKLEGNLKNVVLWAIIAIIISIIGGIFGGFVFGWLFYLLAAIAWIICLYYLYQWLVNDSKI